MKRWYDVEWVMFWGLPRYRFLFSLIKSNCSKTLHCCSFRSQMELLLLVRSEGTFVTSSITLLTSASLITEQRGLGTRPRSRLLSHIILKMIIQYYITARHPSKVPSGSLLVLKSDGESVRNSICLERNWSGPKKANGEIQLGYDLQT